MSNIKRYQNPEVFEQLAIEYAVGALHGRARKRFEALMETHFYLKATTEAYQHKFAHLVELLPDAQPSDQVWKNLESHIKTTATPAVSEAKESWWSSLFNTKTYGLMASALIVSAALIFNPMTGSPIAYTAILESSSTHSPMAVTRISQADMNISIDMMKHTNVPDNMELTLWCHPKGGGKPMMMGTISSSGKTIIKIDKSEWRNFKNVGLLAISLEQKDSKHADWPKGEILLKGSLNSEHKT
ncbi:MAG TPA: hypothetical protein EYG68_06920 [Leucothrix mucor]|nr:hypothetical protein [Leucothrix mucor]